MNHDERLADLADERDDHARLLGYTPDRPKPDGEHCRKHGTYQPTSLLDADCPTCFIDSLPDPDEPRRPPRMEAS